ncbi:MAG TPA: VWA domain-containing protein, partial [Terriglobales bacterium]
MEEVFIIVRRIGPRRFVLLVLALGSLALSGWYQAPSSSAAQVPAPTIRVTTHLVLVDVVVTDKQGNPVSGLRREDFAVEENGKAQKIATFATPAESRAAEAVGELPPGIYSNRPQYRTPPGPVTLLLLDAINTPFKDQAYARLQMLRFVQQQYKPGQRMGIFTL